MSFAGSKTHPVAESRGSSYQPICYTSWLGRTDYQSAYILQKRIWSEKLDGHPEDVMILLEHPPTITIGKSGKLENLLVPQEKLAEQGVSLFFTDRGGDVTYHGPGQMIVYPILHIKDYGYRVVRYVEQLEEVIIRVLRDFGIEGKRDVLNRGVWVKKDKIASIGVAIKRWVSFHGLALNYGTDLSYFDLINPCGLEGQKMTSMAKILGRKISRERLAERICIHFKQTFEREWEEKDFSYVLPLIRKVSPESTSLKNERAII